MTHSPKTERKVFLELECGGYIARQGFKVLVRAGNLPEFVIEGRALQALLCACLEASGVEVSDAK